MTEFGFETNPPDPFSGVPLAQQAQFNTIGEYQAWGNPRIASQAQFLLRDVAPVKKHPKTSKAYWFTYQSGLYGVTGQPKPAATAYATPFLAFNTGALDPTTGAPIYRLWGQLRFVPNGGAALAYDAVAREGRLDAVGHGRRDGRRRPDGLLRGDAQRGAAGARRVARGGHPDRDGFVLASSLPSS